MIIIIIQFLWLCYQHAHTFSFFFFITDVTMNMFKHQFRREPRQTSRRATGSHAVMENRDRCWHGSTDTAIPSCTGNWTATELCRLAFAHESIQTIFFRKCCQICATTPMPSISEMHQWDVPLHWAAVLHGNGEGQLLYFVYLLLTIALFIADWLFIYFTHIWFA